MNRDNKVKWCHKKKHSLNVVSLNGKRGKVIYVYIKSCEWNIRQWHSNPITQITKRHLQDNTQSY